MIIGAELDLIGGGKLHWITEAHGGEAMPEALTGQIAQDLHQIHSVHVVGYGHACERGGHGHHIPRPTGIHEMGKAAQEACLDAVAGLGSCIRGTAKQIDGEQSLI